MTGVTPSEVTLALCALPKLSLLFAPTVGVGEVALSRKVGVGDIVGFCVNDDAMVEKFSSGGGERASDDVAEGVKLKVTKVLEYCVIETDAQAVMVTEFLVEGVIVPEADIVADGVREEEDVIDIGTFSV